MKNPTNTGGALPFAVAPRKKVTVSPEDLTVSEYLSDSHLPLVIRARTETVDLNGWAQSQVERLRSELTRCGAILFRGFPVHTSEQFEAFVRVISGEPMAYRERSSPRSQVSDRVYTSTDYPADQRILPHNEHSYARRFPTKLYFWCEQAAQQGGETPLGDARKVFARLQPDITAKFIDKGWMYVRNFGEHFGVPWPVAFQTTDKAAVEAYCREANIDCEWTRDGLRTRQVRPAMIRHPSSGELIWFNHAMFFHISSVEPGLRARLQAEYGEQDLPNNTYYGDGSPIDDDVAQHLRDAYEQESVGFPWMRGDVILIDNILTTHARAAFAGPRRILFAMAEPHTRTDLLTTSTEA